MNIKIRKTIIIDSQRGYGSTYFFHQNLTKR